MKKLINKLRGLRNNKKFVITLAATFAVIVVMIIALVVINIRVNDSDRMQSVDVAGITEESTEIVNVTSTEIATADISMETTIVSTEVVANASSGSDPTTSNNSGSATLDNGSSGTITNNSGETIDTQAIPITQIPDPAQTPAPAQDWRVVSIIKGEVDMPTISINMVEVSMGDKTMSDLQKYLDTTYPSYGFVATNRATNPEIWENSTNYTFVSSACNDVFMYIP